MAMLECIHVKCILSLIGTRVGSYNRTAPIIRITIEQLNSLGSHSDLATDHQNSLICKVILLFTDTIEFVH